ncbi:MAG: bacteriohemerythrin [Bacteroidetes bacterium]|nr:bacteriohemerythrin [Bacteroidota bacterium]
MALLEWNQDYSVNVSQMDEQHRHLISMINRLYESISNGIGDEAVKPVLDELLDYTAYHFISEEKLLEKHGYYGLRQQKKEHETLTWRVLDLRSRYEAGDEVKPMEMLGFLTDWLKNHLLGSDKEYGAFLNSKGVR